MTENQVKILGWVATFMSVMMYVSYFPQIMNNLAGQKEISFNHLLRPSTVVSGSTTAFQARKRHSACSSKCTRYHFWSGDCNHCLDLKGIGGDCFFSLLFSFSQFAERPCLMSVLIGKDEFILKSWERIRVKTSWQKLE